MGTDICYITVADERSDFICPTIIKMYSYIEKDAVPSKDEFRHAATVDRLLEMVPGDMVVFLSDDSGGEIISHTIVLNRGIVVSDSLNGIFSNGIYTYHRVISGGKSFMETLYPIATIPGRAISSKSHIDRLRNTMGC